MPSPQLENIGMALQGLGAGLGGQLPQFLQAQNQRQGLQRQEQMDNLAMAEKRQQMAIERQKTMFTDANSALQLVDQGNLDGVVRLGIQRLQMLRQLSELDPNIDPSDTQRVTRLAIAARNGDPEALENLKGELSNTVQMGQAIGVLQSQDETLSASEVTGQGQVIRRSPDGTLMAVDVPGFKPDPQSERAPDQRAQRIASLAPQLAQTLGVSPEQAQIEAANVVDGIIKYEVTQQGRVLKIDNSVGTVQELPISGGSAQQLAQIGAEQEAAPPADDGFSLYGLSNEISGIGPTGKAAAAKVASMFGLEAFPETVTQRQIAEGAMQGLVKALSINDQYPVKEIERIREDMAKISPRLTSGGPEIRAQMKGLNTLLTSNLETARRDASNPEMPTEIRAGAARAANDLKNFIDMMGYVDADTLKSAEMVSSVPLSSLEQFVRVTPDSELTTLPDDVEEAIFQRLSRGRTQ